MRDDHDVSGHDGLAPAERLLSRAADGATARGRPLSRRARQTQRSVEAYLKAGVRPRWMERVDEIDQGMRPRSSAWPAPTGRSARSAAGTATAFAAALARARAVVALRPPQRAHRAAQRLVSDRAPAADGPAHRRLRALRGALVSPAGPRPATGSSSTSRPSSTFPAPVRAGRPRARGRSWTPRLLANIGGAWRRAATPRSSSACATSSRSRGSRRPSPRPSRCPGLGNAPAAPLDDLAAKGGSAANAQALATPHVRLPAGHRHRRRPARSTRPLRRTPSAASSTPRWPSATAATRRSSPSRRPSRSATRTCAPRRASAAPRPSPTCSSRPTRASTTRAPSPSTTPSETLGGPRAAVVGVTGAAPAREAQFHEIEQALPLIEAASVVLIAVIVALAFRSIGAPLVALAAAGDRLHDRDARAAVARRARRTSRCPRRSSRSSSSSCSASSPTTRSSSCPRRAAGCARATSACPPRGRRSPRSRRSSSPPA